MDIALNSILGAVLVIGLRVSGIAMFAPFFGSAVIPARMKAAMVIAITAVLYPVYGSTIGPVDLARWPLLAASELLIGLAFGITSNMVFEAAQLAGQVLSIQMGYSLVSLLDPQTEVESTVMSLFHRTVAILLFLQMNVHHWILKALSRSFDYLPPGTATINPMFMAALLRQGAIMLEVALQIAAPVLAATLLADIVLGLLGRASPQMPLLLLGPAAKSLLGLVVLVSVLGSWPDMFERYFAQSIQYTEQLLHLARS
jgi:flagellar biosynthetic protein FliR